MRGYVKLVTTGVLVANGCLLAGCSTLSSANPVNWWHRQEGGKIAEQRPPPPGADQPYPNLSTVPAKPVPPDAEALRRLTNSLVADRTNAQHAAQSAPLADPSSANASPSLFGVGTAPPPPAVTGPRNPPAPSETAGSGIPVAGASGASAPVASAPVASASMPAVDAPVAPPLPSPRKPVQSAPLEAQAVQGSPPQPPSDRTIAPANAPARVDAKLDQPELPSGPPTRPSAAGAPPPAAAPMPEPMPSAATGPSATIVFLNGASNLSVPATDEVKAFARTRGNGTIAVTGFGDAPASDPDVQSTALNLGLSRALSIADALKAAGVPDDAIRVDAEASGRGAALRLLH